MKLLILNDAVFIFQCFHVDVWVSSLYKPDDEAGLYMTAFVIPTCSALGHLAKSGVILESGHLHNKKLCYCSAEGPHDLQCW